MTNTENWSHPANLISPFDETTSWVDESADVSLL